VRFETWPYESARVVDDGGGSGGSEGTHANGKPPETL